MYMQDFTASMCNNAPTPTGTDYFLIGTLKDKRDNKQYEVRKFADGKCWMVDNLAYGGDTASGGVDGCLKTTFDGNTSSTPTNVFGPGTYGDCRYTYDSIGTPDTNKYGYFYTWQAVMQNADAYSGSDYQPVQPVQGICPAGWHVPVGGEDGEFVILQRLVGSPSTPVTFWKAASGWKGVYAGAGNPVSISYEGLSAYYFTSTQANSYLAWRFFFDNSRVLVSLGVSNKHSGYALRCVKDTQEPVVYGCANPTSTMQAWHGCSALTTPTGANFTAGPCLMDERDGKTYQVRKFADGNCWMVTNLAYGGDTRSGGVDGCRKTSYCGYGYNADGSCVTDSGHAVSTWGKIAPHLYGDCRYPYADMTIPDTSNYGYFYNWQAAVQDANAYYGNDYQPSEPTQGLCADGWHLPTGGSDGQVYALYVATGRTATFWRPGGSWHGVYSGGAIANDNLLLFRNERGYQHTSTQASAAFENHIGIYITDSIGAGGVLPATGEGSDKGNGYSIRCLQP